MSPAGPRAAARFPLPCLQAPWGLPRPQGETPTSLGLVHLPSRPPCHGRNEPPTAEHRAGRPWTPLLPPNPAGPACRPPCRRRPCRLSSSSCPPSTVLAPRPPAGRRGGGCSHPMCPRTDLSDGSRAGHDPAPAPVGLLTPPHEARCWNSTLSPASGSASPSISRVSRSGRSPLSQKPHPSVAELTKPNTGRWWDSDGRNHRGRWRDGVEPAQGNSHGARQQYGAPGSDCLNLGTHIFR